MPNKEEALEVEGTVTQALANTRFRVQVDDGRLSMQLGPQEPGHNTCINWLSITPSQPTKADD